MIAHPHPDPVAFAVFGWEVRWYGLMYLAGLSIAWLMARRLARRHPFSELRTIALDNLIVACVLGVILGGRLGYVLFYKPEYYLANPIDILRIWTGGMSFHGGLIGVVIALWALTFLYQTDPPSARRHFFLRLLDFAAVLTPPGLGLGRLGNFINAELPGRVATMDLPWLFNFGYPDSEPRHPSQLYQMLYEGVFLMALMLWLARRGGVVSRPAGALAGVFVVAYAVGRFGIEFFRQPDSHLGLLWLDLTMGQWLSVPMVAAGLLLIYHEAIGQWWQRRRAAADSPPYAADNRHYVPDNSPYATASTVVAGTGAGATMPSPSSSSSTGGYAPLDDEHDRKADDDWRDEDEYDSGADEAADDADEYAEEDEEESDEAPKKRRGFFGFFAADDDEDERRAEEREGDEVADEYEAAAERDEYEESHEEEEDEREADEREAAAKPRRGIFGFFASDEDEEAVVDDEPRRRRAAEVAEADADDVVDDVADADAREYDADADDYDDDGRGKRKGFFGFFVADEGDDYERGESQRRQAKMNRRDKRRLRKKKR